MSNSQLGQHHISVRKRVYKKHEPYPSLHLLKHIVDWFVYVMSVIIPIMTLPQVYEAFINHNAQGLVPITWFTYASTNALWLFYGILHKEKPIIFANATMFALNLLTAVSAVLY